MIDQSLLNKVHKGYCPEALKIVPDNSIHCVITSPPYYSLREYAGVKQQIWRGDPSCEHSWQEEETIVNRSGGESEIQEGSKGAWYPEGLKSKYAFCSKCGAFWGCLGLEPNPQLYINNLVEVFREVRRVLHPSGTAWVVIGDSYAGSLRGYNKRMQKCQVKSKVQLANKGSFVAPPDWSKIGLKPKDLIGIPWMFAFAMRTDGWWLRQEIIWSKKGGSMPEPVTDRCTRAHETVFMFTKNRKYYYDHFAISEPAKSLEITWPGSSPEELEEVNAEKGLTEHAAARRYPIDRSCGTSVTGKANKRSVWDVSPHKECADAHFATYPRGLINPMILAGTSEHGCCSKCFNPYRRKLQQVNPCARTSGRHRDQAEYQAEEGRLSVQRPTSIQEHEVGIYETIGWEPTCDCNTETSKCIVMDPFAGSGTTLVESIRLGRDTIGFDASDQYVDEIAEFRIVEAQTGLTKAEQKRGQKLLFEIEINTSSKGGSPDAKVSRCS